VGCFSPGLFTRVSRVLSYRSGIHVCIPLPVQSHSSFHPLTIQSSGLFFNHWLLRFGTSDGHRARYCWRVMAELIENGAHCEKHRQMALVSGWEIRRSIQQMSWEKWLIPSPDPFNPLANIVHCYTINFSLETWSLADIHLSNKPPQVCSLLRFADDIQQLQKMNIICRHW